MEIKERKAVLKTVMIYCCEKMKDTTYWEANHQGDPHCIVWNGANAELVEIERNEPVSLDKSQKKSNDWGGAKQW